MDWSSKAVVPPETTTYAHLGAESSAGDAVAATYRYVDENEADFNSAQLFWNRRIGVSGWLPRTLIKFKMLHFGLMVR